jgi:hypothetical protein
MHMSMDDLDSFSYQPTVVTDLTVANCQQKY